MMIHTYCPIDSTDVFDVEVYPASFDLSQIDAGVFSARRMPDRIHYRMVRNTKTGCLRADPILNSQTIVNLYHESSVTYESLSPFAADTYLKYLYRALPLLPDKRGVLEVGCGHGFFLEHLKPMGFGQVMGIEPSLDAVAKAKPEIRPHIIQGALRPGLFGAGIFSLICGFQVLDHLVNPNECLQVCRELLSPGGIMLWICHDIGSPFAQLLGRWCPMIDIEHVVLYDRKTIARLFEKNGFDVIDVFGVWNRYPLQYWTHLAPVPEFAKRWLLKLLDLTRFGHLALSANFGNLGILAREPVPRLTCQGMNRD